MDQILLPMCHDSLSHDTAINKTVLAQLGTTFIMTAMTGMTSGQVYATLPPGYSFQNAYLQGQNQPCHPCPNQRTTTQTYTYELPANETQQFYSRDLGRNINQIQVDNRRIVLFELF